jgi:phospholipase/carboxylesterase
MTGLRFPEKLAGLVGLSGYLPLAALTTAERHAANASTPVFLAHGSADPVVPVARGLAARDTLTALGHPLEWHEYGMEHTLCIEEIGDLNRWLLRVLSPAKETPSPSGRGQGDLGIPPSPSGRGQG